MSNTATRLLRCAAILSAAMVGVIPVEAQTPPQGPPQAAPAFPEFATVVKGLQPLPGLLTLYQSNPNDPAHDSTKLLAQIPRGLMGQDLLLASTISRGEQAGLDGNDYMIRFQQQDKRVMILVPDTDYISRPNTTAADLVSRTHTPTFLAALPIVAMTPNGDPVVDLGSVALGSLGELPAPYSPQTMGFVGLAGQRRDLSRITKVKSFPENVVIDVDLAFIRRDGSGENLGMSYAFRRLPAMGSYAPRAADERIGYFATVQEDWGAKHSERDNYVRYIYRWDLKKKDPTLEMSPPEKPITFVLEKTIPLQWRKYVADGVLEWNKAFEKIGISNAMVVEQQTDDNEFANVDPEDARYNFIRWMISGDAYAMAQFRADPRTGQLLNTEIVFDDSMLRAYNHEFEVFGPGPVAATLGADFLKFLDENPKYLPSGQSPEDVKRAAAQMRGPFALDDSPTPAGITRHENNRLTRSARFSACQYGAGMQRELEIGNVLAGATGRKIPERLVGEVIKETISHEVGHTLGLRHNFKASSWLALDEIKRRRDTTDDSMSASVMDYNPTLFFANDDIDKVRHFISPTIGPYDYWAVEYGYRTNGPQDGGEKEMLAKITGQSGAREHAYATDEDTTSLSPDPLTNRYDMGSDPLGWAKLRMDLCDSLLKDITKWGERKQQPRHYLLSAYGMVMSEKARNMLYVSRVPTGEYFNRNRIGDADAKPPIELLDPKQQRQAIKMLSDTIFKDNYFPSDPDLLNQLVPSRDWDLTGMVSERIDFPIHQAISRLQAYALLNLCTPYAMQRVYDAELKSKSDDKFTAAELLTSLRDDIWSELQSADADKKYTDAVPMISSIRRNLQRQHLSYLLASVSGRSSYMSPDLQSMVRQEARELGDRISDVLAKNKQADSAGQIDFATRAHLSECRDEIDHALDVQHIRRVEN